MASGSFGHALFPKIGQSSVCWRNDETIVNCNVTVSYTGTKPVFAVCADGLTNSTFENVVLGDSGATISHTFTTTGEGLKWMAVGQIDDTVITKIKIRVNP
jgi:hypothetical protein